jgi:hypothetical protein
MQIGNKFSSILAIKMIVSGIGHSSLDGRLGQTRRFHSKGSLDRDLIKVAKDFHAAEKLVKADVEKSKCAA